MNTPRSPFLLILLSTALLVVACGSAAGSPAPSPTPVGGPVTTPEQAVARVLQHEPRLVGITARDPDAIGQADWYEVAPASGVGVFIVSARVGWGDCESGCISEHTWVYAIGPNGEVTLQSEGGEAVPASEWPTPGVGTGGTGGSGGLDGPGTGLFVTALAGPTCPVEQPGDPECAPRPVVGAVVIVTDGQGNGVAKVQVDDLGTAFIELPAGSYMVEVAVIDSMMGTPGAQPATVLDGARTPVDFAFDTGIRAPG